MLRAVFQLPEIFLAVYIFVLSANINTCHLPHNSSVLWELFPDKLVFSISASKNIPDCTWSPVFSIQITYKDLNSSFLYRAWYFPDHTFVWNISYLYLRIIPFVVDRRNNHFCNSCLKSDPAAVPSASAKKQDILWDGRSPAVNH